MPKEIVTERGFAESELGQSPGIKAFRDLSGTLDLTLMNQEVVAVHFNGDKT